MKDITFPRKAVCCAEDPSLTEMRCGKQTMLTREASEINDAAICLSSGLILAEKETAVF